MQANSIEQPKLAPMLCSLSPNPGTSRQQTPPPGSGLSTNPSLRRGYIRCRWHYWLRMIACSSFDLSKIYLFCKTLHFSSEKGAAHLIMFLEPHFTNTFLPRINFPDAPLAESSINSILDTPSQNGSSL